MLELSVIPQGWTKRTLGKIITISSGKGLVKAQQEPSGKYTVYGGNGVIGNHDEYLFKEKQLIIGRVGVHCGNVHITKNKSWITDNAFVVNFDHEELTINFLYYLLKVLNLNKYSSSTAQPVISQGKLYPIEVFIPPFSEQREIVAKIEELLSELDQGKQQLETARQQLKVYRQAVLKWAFEGKLTNAIQTGQKNQKCELPDGWKWVKLGDVSKVSGGLTKNSKREALSLKVPFLRVANVYFNRIDLTEVHTIGINEGEIERVKLVKDDLLFVEGNGSIDQIGRVALWNGGLESCVHQNHLIKSRLGQNIKPKYALYFFCSTGGRNMIKQQANSTSGLHTLNLSKISNLELPLPSIEEQNQIVQEIESRLSVCDKVEETITQSLQQVETLRQSILKQAFEGKLTN